MYQCENCGCAENTAWGNAHTRFMKDLYDFTGIEHLEGKLLCSACGPTKYKRGGQTKYGKWHNHFKRKFLPKGVFIKNREGNLVHKINGDSYNNYVLESEEDIKKLDTY
jgi:hypothetical protein